MTAPAPAPKYLGRSRVADRYGKCTRTIKRWKEKGILPDPDLILDGIGEFWTEETLDKNDREQTAAAAKSAA